MILHHYLSMSADSTPKSSDLTDATLPVHRESQRGKHVPFDLLTLVPKSVCY